MSLLLLGVFRFTALLAVIFLAASLRVPAADASSLTVSAPAGRIQGINDFGVDAFEGIPYAVPPVGKLRWKPPKAHPKLKGTFQATGFGLFCTQSGIPTSTISEDCLTLNVFRPTSQNQQSGLPVMVWIHGGGLTSGGSFLYDPSPLVNTGNLIVVTINYRLGLLGFFANPAVDKEKHLSGNYGLMDQQLALQWVQENIQAFGGDPNLVTIFGESAGGESIYSNLASPTAAGLFQRAIAESGSYTEFQDYFDSISIVPIAEAETSGTPLVPSGTTLANALGCSGKNAARCLRKVPASALVNIQPGVLYPFIDGTVLTQTLTNAFSSGQFNQVPVIAGSNHDEWRVFVAQQYGSSLTDQEYPDAVAALVMQPVNGQGVQSLINDKYPLSNYSSPSAPLALGALGTDFIFACTARKADQLLAQHVPTWAYEFNDENAPDDFEPQVDYPLGAYHAAEVFYLFDIYQRFAGIDPDVDPFSSDQLQLSDSMIGYWTEFATTGDPNGNGQPTWNPYTSTGDGIPGDVFLSLVPPTPAMESTFDTIHQCSSLWDTF